ncbi:Gfo/Idh/MocA family protein [Novosphingobium sp. BL-52-GroH]|uniref:Gfo/Idh/MocA family protein n=1 Tax=Novosphingobium sp. BL-52-GroH TaxID=3349877 RepID=UPI00384BC2FE
MRRLRMGMIGGGPGSFIGGVHRLAAEMDRRIELVAGAFSSDPARSRAAGESYRIDPARAYDSYQEMFAAERLRDDPIDFVAVVTPNHLHLPATAAALAASFPVMSDKPMTATLDEARELAALVQATGVTYRLTYTYTGYPLVREMRQLIASGALGAIRKVVVEYAQGWLAEPLERAGNKQAEWRADPAQSGLGGCIGDIGVHAFNLAEFVTGQRVTRICADLNSMVTGRRLDDDCNVLLRFANGAPGVLIASQISVGERNGLRLRVYGETGAVHWQQENPNTLTIDTIDGRTEVRHAASGLLGADALAVTRVPTGHPEGYLEAFANLYADFAALLAGETTAPLLPDAAEGLRAMGFISTAVTSNAAGGGWTDLAL